MKLKNNSANTIKETHMKMFKLALVMTAIVISPSMYGMLQRQHSSSSAKNFRKFDLPTIDMRDPKLSAKPISEPIKDPNSRINGILLHSVYGATAKNPDHALADFEEARAMSQQSYRVGAPLPLGVFYNMRPRQKEATKIIYDGLEESGDNTQLSVSPEKWCIIGSDTPFVISRSLSKVEVGLQRSGDKKIAHVAAHTAQGGSIGAGIAATISLANNGYGSAEKEITQLLCENKEKAFKHCIASVIKSMPRAIDESLDYATKNLNNLDIAPAGKHCDQTYSYDNTFFADVTQQVGSILIDEAIASATDYGKSLAAEQLPTSLLNISKGAIKAEDVFLGGAIGAGVGLGYGIYTMGDPIQKAPLHQIYCARV